MKNEKNREVGFFVSHGKWSIVLIYNIVSLLVLAIFYPLIPELLGYAPGFNQVTKELGASYDLQFIVVGAFTFIIGTVIFLVLFKGLDSWSGTETSFKKSMNIEKIRKKCLSMPYVIYICQLTIVNIPLITMALIIKGITNFPILNLVKLIIVIFSGFSLAATFSYIFTKKIFTRILLKTYTGQELQGIRIRLTHKIFLQILPMLTVAILFTALIGYAHVIEEKGDLVYQIVNDKLDNMKEMDSDSEEAILNTLSDIKVNNIDLNAFIVNPTGKIVNLKNEVFSEHYKYYIAHPVNGNRVYGDTIEDQGVVKKVKILDSEFTIGIKFTLASEKTLQVFLIIFAGVFLVNMFVLYFFSRTLTNEVKLVTNGLAEIVDGEYDNLNKKLAVISNDELGDLVVAFNKIQEKEIQNLLEIRENQLKIMEQERLANLGQLIGGIAHNLKTPIMSISGGIEGLRDLVGEYDASIDDETITKENHHEIAKDMNEWLSKMKPYCTYMSDIIKTVKDQTVISASDSNKSFTLGELSKRIDILMNHQLRIHDCRIIKNFEANMDIQIKGEISYLLQVLSNLIMNSVEAYEKKDGTIEFGIKTEQNKVVFSITDYGPGIPDEIKDKIFREMFTSKGKDGSGLGLYISYSNIKGRFGGDMWVETKMGFGTSVYLSIPMC